MDYLTLDRQCYFGLGTSLQKLGSVVSLNLSALAVLGLAMNAQSPQITLEKFSFPDIDVKLATDVSVDPYVSALVNAPTFKLPRDVMRFSVVIENKGPQRIIAYSLRVSYVDVLGKTGGINRHHYNLSNTDNGVEILPGSRQIVTPFDSYRAQQVPRGKEVSTSSGSPQGERARNAVDFVLKQSTVSVSIDLIALENGRTLGPRQTGSFAFLSSLLTHGRETLAFIDQSSSKGVSLRTMALELGHKATAESSNKTQEGFARTQLLMKLSEAAMRSQPDLDRELAELRARRSVTLIR